MADQEKKDQEMNIALNPEHTPILYTDNIFMNVNQDGVTLDVCQKIGTTNQMQVVSRVGMSLEHAKKFVSRLSELVALSAPKKSKN